MCLTAEPLSSSLRDLVVLCVSAVSRLSRFPCGKPQAFRQDTNSFWRLGRQRRSLFFSK